MGLLISLDAMPVPLSKGRRGYAWVDAQDHAAVLACGSWTLVPRRRGNTDYAKSHHGGLLHRFVAACAGLCLDAHVDHEDRDGLNCTRGNLRAATPKQNHGNVGAYQTNTSGYKGVSIVKRKYPLERPWVAQILYLGRQRGLGYFASPESAARAYDEWAWAQWGEFAHLNFPRGA